MTEAAFRTCTICRQSLPVDAFFKSERSRCKPCHSARMKEIRLTNPDVQKHDRERAKRPERKRFLEDQSRRRRHERPDQYKAHTTVNNAIRAGTLKKLPCTICGTTERVQAHHDDYSKPLDVKWLCAKCHKRLHANFPNLIGARP